MSNIRGKDTKPEVLVRRFLFSQGLRFRKNDARYPGKPDILLPKYKAAIFIHGCFWHGHSCRAGKLPSTRRRFWEGKIQKNKERDKSNISEMLEEGWFPIIVWQCQLSNRSKANDRMSKLLQEIYNH